MCLGGRLLFEPSLSKFPGQVHGVPIGGQTHLWLGLTQHHSRSFKNMGFWWICTLRYKYIILKPFVITLGIALGEEGRKIGIQIY